MDTGVRLGIHSSWGNGAHPVVTGLSGMAISGCIRGTIDCMDARCSRDLAGVVKRTCERKRRPGISGRGNGRTKMVHSLHTHNYIQPFDSVQRARSMQPRGKSQQDRQGRGTVISSVHLQAHPIMDLIIRKRNVVLVYVVPAYHVTTFRSKHTEEGMRGRTTSLAESSASPCPSVLR